MTMILTIDSNITIYNPSMELRRWCKKELTVSNPDYSKKLRMGFWLGDTPQYLAMYEIRGDSLVLPYGVLNQLPKKLIENAIWVSHFKEPTKVDYKADIPLYAYQEAAVDQMLKAKHGILQAPAGSGKTQMGLAMVAKLGKRALWLCHTQDLLRQSRDRASQYMNKKLFGTITAGKVNLGRGITFATVQTMCKLDLAQYKDYWDVIITDEVHRVSGTPSAVTRYQKVLNSLSARNKYGLSATVHRADDLIKTTYALVGKVEHVIPVEAVKSRIMNVSVQPLATGIRLSRECLNTDGTICYAKMINYLTETEERNEGIRRLLIENSKGHSTLVLSDRVKHLQALLNSLPETVRKKAVMIDGKMTSKKGKAKRQQAIEDMRTGEKKILFATYALAKEGLDIPVLDRLIMATPQKDYAVITQSLGRVARVAPGKKEPIAYDLVDDIRTLIKSYKKRLKTYQKIGSEVKEGREL